MPDRARLLAGAAGAALLVAAVLVLREPAEPEPGPPPPPDRVTRYVADSVVVPEPGDPPAPPSDVRASPGPRVSWRGSAPGYEVRWPGGFRLVTGPEVQLDGVAPGTPVTVRAVDAYGRWSTPVEVLAPGPRPSSGLTGLYDDFADDSSVRADAPGSLWHLSGYRGCVDVGARSPARVGLVVDLTCGSDVAVLRSRVPLRLIGGRGRAAVLTDAAGPGGRLTLDLVPGPADRVGAEPAGVRAVLDDVGAQVLPGGVPIDRPARGAGVLHLVEVEVTPSGVSMRVDGEVVATSRHVPRWREAYLLIGVQGPGGRKARVHVAGAGFSGPITQVPLVVEAPVTMASRQVLDLAEEAPDLGIARRPLASAATARIVATLSAPAGLDLSRLVVQLGDSRVPARLAAPVKPGHGAVATVIADVPAGLLGPRGPASLSPVALRAPSPGRAMVLESYLEVEPRPGATFSRTTPPPGHTPGVDALPETEITLGDSAGQPLPEATAPAGSRLVVEVRLDGRAAQWDTGSLAGVEGLEVRLNSRLLAAIPTSADTPSGGGTYTIALGLAGVPLGQHVLETKVVGARTHTSTLTVFRVK